jgi:hypothetical protein
VTAPYKNPAHAVADALMAALQGLTGAVGGVRARRAKAGKDRQVAQALAVVEAPPPPPRGHLDVPLFGASDVQPGYCGFCGHVPCRCLRGDAA